MCANFFSSLFNWIDLVAILPFYIGLILRALTGGESAAKRLIVLRVIRLTRVFRIFKLSKYNEGVQVVWVSLSQSSDALSLLVFLVVLITVLFGSAMFYAEQLAAQWDEDNRTWVRLDYYGGPAVDHPFQSIFNGYWWCIVTVTTVGYGDLVPVTFPGYLVGVMTMFCGVLTLAFPVIIIGAKFTDVRRDYTAEKERVEAEALAEAGYRSSGSQRQRQKRNPRNGSRPSHQATTGNPPQRTSPTHRRSHTTSRRQYTKGLIKDKKRRKRREVLFFFD